jgi:ribosomal protein L34E
MKKESNVFIHIHKPKKDHECDSNGPHFWGLKDGTITKNEEEAKTKGHTWGSVSCSVCESISMIEEGWY